jgi:tRNA (guanine-N7-)-methyltransferase
MSTKQSQHLVSFGRRHGRKLRANHSVLMETLLPGLLLTLSEGGIAPESFFTRPAVPFWFEIGFGGGEHLVEQARMHPDVNFIGCEPFVNGMAKLLAAIDKEKLTNIRLYDGDARLILERLPDASIERLFILFPDPWPKVRHHKRRIISQEGLALFYRKLMPQGVLRLATDHVDYGAWMLEHLVAFGKFEWTAKSSADWKNPPADWVKTRYQVKAEAEGRGALFLDWVKGR